MLIYTKFSRSLIPVFSVCLAFLMFYILLLEIQWWGRKIYPLREVLSLISAKIHKGHTMWSMLKDRYMLRVLGTSEDSTRVIWETKEIKQSSEDERPFDIDQGNVVQVEVKYTGRILSKRTCCMLQIFSIYSSQSVITRLYGCWALEMWLVWSLNFI